MKPKPKVIIESHIPAVPDGLADSFEIVRLAPADITPEAVADADALIVRTRTRCDSALLKDSNVRFVATATIGTDHLDLEWLRSQGIEAVSAPGCNAPAVAQYLFASLLAAGISLSGKKIAVVGVGHVGSIVARWAQQLGMTVLKVDPPRERRGDPGNWMSLDQAVAQADIITFHTPLTRDGIDATFHLCDAKLISKMRRGVTVVNAARGQIVDTEALIQAIDNGHVTNAVIDCWEGEPDIDRRLLQKAVVATPHIAGYSHEGKHRATRRVVEALCRHFNVVTPQMPAINDPDGCGAASPSEQAIAASYNPLVDTGRLRQEFTPGLFEQLRNSYPLRHEVC